MTEKESFLDALKSRILLFDGAMGTEIQKYEQKSKDNFFTGNLFLFIKPIASACPIDVATIKLEVGTIPIGSASISTDASIKTSTFSTRGPFLFPKIPIILAFLFFNIGTKAKSSGVDELFERKITGSSF